MTAMGLVFGAGRAVYVSVDNDIPLRSSGEIEHTPTPQLLWDLSLRQFTGSLLVRTPDEGLLRGESCFAFEDGRMTQARLPTACDALGKVLFDEGLISLEQLDVSLERMRAGEGLQGAVLVAMGACDRAAVERCLREQLRRKVLRLFALTEGRWELHAQIDLLEDFGGRRMPIDVSALLWDGVRANATHPLVDVVLDRLGTRRLRIIKSSPAMLLYGVGEGERLLLEGLAEGRRVHELQSLGVAPSKVRSLVYLLAVTRQLERVRSAPSAPAPQVPSVPPTAHPQRPAALASVAPPPVPATSIAPPAPSIAPVPISVTASLPPLREPTVMPPPTPSLAPSPAVSIPPPRISLVPAGVSIAPSVANDVGANTTELDEKVTRATEVARVRTSLRRNLYIEAEHTARAALARKADDPVLLILLAQALLAQEVDGHLPEVRRCLSRGLAAQPDNDEGYVVAATMYRRDGDHRRALACFVKAYRINPRNVDAVRELRIASMRRRGAQRGDGDGLLARLLTAR